MNLSITASEAGDASRLVVTGEVDVSNATELRSAIEGAFAQGARRVEVDLAHVAYIDSTGIGVLVGASQRAGNDGRELVVANPQTNVRRVLGLLGVEKQLRIDEK